MFPDHVVQRHSTRANNSSATTSFQVNAIKVPKRSVVNACRGEPSFPTFPSSAPFSISASVHVFLPSRDGGARSDVALHRGPSHRTQQSQRGPGEGTRTVLALRAQQVHLAAERVVLALVEQVWVEEEAQVCRNSITYNSSIIHLRTRNMCKIRNK